MSYSILNYCKYDFNSKKQKALREMYSKGFCHKGNDIKMWTPKWTPKSRFLMKNSIFDCIKLSNMQKKSGIYTLISHKYPILVRS